MSLSFKFIPLTFLNDENEIKKQIRNTIILKYFFERNSEIVHLEDLITGTQYGYNASALVEGRNKFLRISDITDGKVNWKTVPYCNCTDEETYLLFPNDILIARTGGTTGKSFLISEPPALSIYAGYLFRIRANDETNPNYLNLFLNSYVYWSQIVSLNEDNFRPSVNANKLKKLILPKCDETAQNDAVKISNGELVNGYDDLYQLIGETLLKYDKLKEIQFEKNNQLELQKALKQSILSEALQGKLTEKWREENPTIEVASKLLERITGKPSMMNLEGGRVSTGHNHGDSSMPMNEDKKVALKTNKTTISSEAKKSLQPLYKDYFEFKDALTKDDFNSAKKALLAFEKSFNKINMSVFKGESHKVWMNYQTELKKQTLHATHIKNIKELRMTFEPISNVMVAMTKAFNPLNESAYVQFCPMANSDKGANWLSKENKVVNPYFGASMIKCGEVKETIK